MMNHVLKMPSPESSGSSPHLEGYVRVPDHWLAVYKWRREGHRETATPTFLTLPISFPPREAENQSSMPTTGCSVFACLRNTGASTPTTYANTNPYQNYKHLQTSGH